MVNCISFSTVNIKILIPLIGGICSLTLRILASLQDKDTNILKRPIMASICSSLGMTLSFIPYLIMIKRAKTKKQKIKKKLLSSASKSKNLKSLIINNESIYEKMTFNKFKYLLLAACFDFFESLLLFFVYKSIELNLWILNFLLICCLSSCIFGTKLYKHQKFSLSMVVSLGFFLDLFNYIFFSKGYVFNLFDLCIRIMSEVFFSFLMILDKYLIETKFISPYRICFYIGVITFFLYSICIIISSNIPSKENENLFKINYNGEHYFDHFLSYIENINMMEIIYFIITMIIQLFNNLSILLTIRYFSPTHTMFIIVIGKTEPYIEKIINGGKKGDNAIFIIPFLIILVIFFFLLIFNEVIELNCFKLEKNTIKNIQKRAMSECPGEIYVRNEDSFSSSSEGDNEDSIQNENEIIEEKELTNISTRYTLNETTL